MRRVIVNLFDRVVTVKYTTAGTGGVGWSGEGFDMRTLTGLERDMIEQQCLADLAERRRPWLRQLEERRRRRA